MSAPAGLSLALKRNHKWKPNGPMDYARSARKWGIQPTEHTTFFVQDNTLLRRGVPNGLVSPGGTKKSFLGGLFKKHHGSGGGGGATSGGGSTTKPTAGSGSEVPADDVQNDLEYVVPVTIGTPGVTLKLDFDTGSADLWVWSSLLKTTAANLASHTIYNPAKSSTAAVDGNLTWNISYGDGSSASGKVYTDTVNLGGLAIPGQAVELANKLSSSFLQGEGSDGLLGLAFPSINTVTTPQKTPMENLIEQGLIPQPIFTVKLDKGDSAGFYTFGYVDASVALASGTSADSDAFAYTAIDSSNGFWEFESPEVKVGSKVVKRASGNTAIADTGTTLILVDDAAVSAIYGAIPGANLDDNAGGWILPTTNQSSTALPDIAFSVGTGLFSISGEDLKFADAGNGMSFGAVQSRGQNPQDILGDVFLKRVYAIFDQTPGNPRIGFAQRSLE